MKITRPTGEEILVVLRDLGCKDYFINYVVGPFTVTGNAQLKLVWGCLRKKPEIFQEGSLHRLHADVGKRRADFRSIKGKVCPGSLQVVVDLDSGRFYCDIDAWNPYQDLVNWVGHSFFEVLLPTVLGKDERRA